MKRPVVLLLGDSISMGYRNYVKSMLIDCCKTMYYSENCETSSRTYRLLYDLYYQCGGESNNVRYIYWNNGLWDVVRIFGEDNQESIEGYISYLSRIHGRLRLLFPNAYICFATTTPVNEERYTYEFYRRNEDIENYNDAAKNILEGKVDEIDDLYSFIKEQDGDKYVDATHFTFNLNKLIAKRITQNVHQVLKDEIHEVLNGNKIIESKSNEVLDLIIKRKYNERIAIWGAGRKCKKYLTFFKKFCNITAIADTDSTLNGCTICGTKCFSASSINEYADFIIIAIENKENRLDVEERCKKVGIPYVDYESFLKRIIPIYTSKKSSSMKFEDVSPSSINSMAKYIGVDIPVNVCNLKCSYCYLKDYSGNRSVNSLVYSPKYIRMQLSRNRVGGSALIGMTADGETMLDPLFNELCIELLKEGHYLHIVTNGLMGEKIRELIADAGEYSQHIIFKLSFHYLQLLERNLLGAFIENAHFIINSMASVTIEIMPHDELVEYIPEILNLSIREFGAYPQLTIGRDPSRGLRLLSKMSFQDFYDTWKVFDSEMFEMRVPLYMDRGNSCKAGKRSFFLNIESGDIRRCTFDDYVGNIYCDEVDSLDFPEVGNSCPQDYCFNCHVYATLGILPKPDVPTYMKIRDRRMQNGEHWIKDDMRRFLDIKL